VVGFISNELTIVTMNDKCYRNYLIYRKKMPVKKFCLGGTLSWRAFVLADCNREVKADVKSTLCHDQTLAIGINLCVYRIVCLRMNL